jgi:hypothetical protein
VSIQKSEASVPLQDFTSETTKHKQNVNKMLDAKIRILCEINCNLCHIIYHSWLERAPKCARLLLGICCFLVPTATYGTEPWTLNKVISKRPAIFENKSSKKECLGGVKVSENWRKR